MKLPGGEEASKEDGEVPARWSRSPANRLRRAQIACIKQKPQATAYDSIIMLTGMGNLHADRQGRGV
ncbi:MAG: hypothetical protein H6816_11475 [Phycisphaerales bacterium]|nr:hypothetical protein [Phycisphaerales bacterium]